MKLGQPERNEGEVKSIGHQGFVFKNEQAQHKQIHKQMLERMQRKGNSSALLVGMQTGEATVQNSMEFPQKTKNGTAL